MSSFLQNIINLAHPQGKEGKRVVGHRCWWFAFADDFADVFCGLGHQRVMLRCSGLGSDKELRFGRRSTLHLYRNRQPQIHHDSFTSAYLSRHTEFVSAVEFARLSDSERRWTSQSSCSRASCSVKIGGRWLATRGLGRASIGWILEDCVVSGSREGGSIGGWMNGIAEPAKMCNWPIEGSDRCSGNPYVTSSDNLVTQT